MIPAIVLAAGASMRMGRPKPLLGAGNRTFVRRILDTLHSAGVADAVVVVRPGHHDTAAEVGAAGALAIVNPAPDAGQLSSLLAGLDALDTPEVDAVLVTLVDVPLIQPSTVRTLLARAAASAAPIVRAVHRGRHGHPVIFKRAVFDALRRADPAVGAKAVFAGVTVENVEVDDPGVVDDIDTPEDYETLTGATANLPRTEDV
ncbi:MAG TPA: nucleotidyltransferase family protein [Vicinamibacterales bacterium]|nr:nucleotidyltransferase family protein [Vicinamibacterales bacterium]